MNLTSVSSVETHSQSLLCFLPTELNVSSRGSEYQGVGIIGVGGAPGFDILHTDVFWGTHLSSVVDPPRLPVTFLLTGQLALLGPTTFPTVSAPPWRRGNFSVRLCKDPLPVFTLKFLFWGLPVSGLN